MKIMKRLQALLLVFVMLFTSFFQVGNVFAQVAQPDQQAASLVGVTYQTHVQNKGTMDWMSNGELSGTEGQGLRMEGMKIKLVNAPADASIDYYCHVENIGDQKPDRINGELAGTEGQWLRLEALHIVLNNMPGYSVQYRVHVQNDGWQQWVSDGAISGTQGRGLRLEAVEIRIVKTSSGVQATSVSLNTATASISAGTTQTLSATVLPADATNKDVTWTSDNAAIATVDNGGKVTGVSEGTANIVATTVDGGFIAGCAVTVTPAVAAVPVTGISLNQIAVNITKDASRSLIATVMPANATNKDVTWLSDNGAVATVDKVGKVTGVKAGTATITGTTVDGGLTAICKVTVKNPAPPAPAATLSSIAITTPATKLVYEVGDALDLTGLVVTGTYSDGTTKIKPVTDKAITEKAVTGFDSSAQVIDQVLTITIGGKTTTYTITVLDPLIEAYNAAVAAVPAASAPLYDAASYAAYQAIVAANPITAASTPAQIAAATAAIQAAQAALVAASSAAAAYIAAVAAVTPSASLYTPASLAAYNAVVAANQITATSTQAQILAAAAAIQAAQAALVAASPEAAAYIAAIAAVTPSANLYTAASLAAYQAVVAANTITAASTPAQIAAATAAIQAAQAALVAASPEAAAYIAAVAAVTPIASLYTPASLAAYQAVIAANPITAASTPAQIAAATAAIQAAQAALVAASPEAAAYIAAVAAVTPSAAALYTPASLAIYNAVVAANPITAASTPAQIAAATAAIQAAQAALVAASPEAAAYIAAMAAVPTSAAALYTPASLAIYNAVVAANPITAASTAAQIAAATAAIQAAQAALVAASPEAAAYIAVVAAVTPASAALYTPASLVIYNAVVAANPITAASTLAQIAAATAAIQAAQAALVAASPEAAAYIAAIAAVTPSTLYDPASLAAYNAVVAANPITAASTPAQIAAATAAIIAAQATLATANLAAVIAVATALVPANYVDFAGVTAALALPATTLAEQIAAAAAINAAIAALVTPAQAVTNLATATAAAAALVPANYVDFTGVTAALALPVVTPAEQVAATAAINAAIAALVTPAQAMTNLATATAAATALVPANYVDFAGVTAALALPAVTAAEQVAAAAAINAAIAALVTPAQAATNLATATAAAAALVSADYMDFAGVTAALALPATTPAEQVAQAAAINAAIAALVTTSSNLATAIAAATALVPADYLDFAGVTAALALPATTPAEQIAQAAAINAAIAALVTQTQALATATATAGALSPAEYSNFAAVTAALALPEVTPADITAKTAAINAAIAALVIIADTTPPVIEMIGSNPASTSQVTVVTGVTDAYPDPGTYTVDNLAGDITARVVVTGTVDRLTVGTYPLTYTATDAAGNVATMIKNVNVVARIDPTTIPQFTTPLLIPWAMPKSVDPNTAAPVADYYEIAMRQFSQQMLPTTDSLGNPTGFPTSVVWGYGSNNKADINAVDHAPSLTVEAMANVPSRIKWSNELVDANNNYLPHILPNDQTIEAFPTDITGTGNLKTLASQSSYVGPVPITTHVHGAHVIGYSDGYPESWYMPAADNIPAGITTVGPSYVAYKAAAQSGAQWTTGNSVFDYTNDQRANTIWYHDHAMGFTRTNVYAGGAGFYLIRDNPADTINDAAMTLNVAGTAVPAVLPGPAPVTMQEYVDSIATGSVYEIPIALQDRTFNTDGTLWYPGSRTDFDGYTGPYAPGTDVAPIWNPEVFGDTIIVNGNTWPTLNVQPKKYRIRFLNGSNARTFILGLNDLTTPANNINLSFWQIGTDGGFLNAPANLTTLLSMPAQRADVIVDFSKATVGDSIILTNVGPDSPYQGGLPGSFPAANPTTTGQVMEFKVIPSDGTPDLSTDPSLLVLPTVVPEVPTPTAPVRTLSLNEMTSMQMDATGASIGPVAAMLGTASVMNGVIVPMSETFMMPITTTIKLYDTEVWEIYNFTADAHPIHIHLTEFQVIDRQELIVDPATGSGTLGTLITQPEVWETGYNDTVTALPGQVTRVKAYFDLAGLYVWHCHILEHEENDMMRPYLVQ
ncbi:MAG: Ig-like domain-containing protein [Acetobacterium sp.]